MAIEITEGTTSLLIDILREHIYKHTGDEYSDKATHPIEVNLLDQLIEKREAFRKVSNLADTRESIQNDIICCVESNMEIVQRFPDLLDNLCQIVVNRFNERIEDDE